MEHLKKIQDILGVELVNGEEDLKRIAEEWHAFYIRPDKYANSAVVDAIFEWYQVDALNTLIRRSSIVEFRKFNTESGEHIMIYVLEDTDNVKWYVETNNNVVISMHEI